MPDEPKPCPKAWCPFMGCSACEYQGERAEHVKTWRSK